MTHKPDTPDGQAGTPAILSRRTLLGVAATAGVVTVGGVVWVGTRDPRDFIADLVKASLPGSTLDEPSLQVFAQDFMDEFYERFKGGTFDQEKLLAAVKIHAASAARGVLGAEAFIPGGALEAQGVGHVRRALTRYLMNSNYFYLTDPTSEPIVYRFKSTACSNPFADLRPPTPEEQSPWPI